MDSARIVVGFDGSAGSRAALRWALDEAARRGAEVRLVNVRDPDQRPKPGDPFVTALGTDPEPVLEHTAREAARDHPAHPTVIPLVLDGPAGICLSDESSIADTIVLGRQAGVPHPGTVTQLVAEYARCPLTVVVPNGPPVPPDGAVVAGVDRSAHALSAVGYAFEEADLLGVEVVLVRAWLPACAAPDAGEADEYDLLAAAAHRWRDRYPGIRVSLQVLPGRAADVLPDTAAKAQLLVVGAHGRGGLPVLGSTPWHALSRSPVPVVIVR